jgi:type II secretory pathway pseudopilin PulG
MVKLKKSALKALPRIRELLVLRRLETGFSMLEAVVVVGVLLALAVTAFFSYGAITDNAKKAKVKSAASEIHTGVLVANSDGDPNTKPDAVIKDWNDSTDKIKVEILPPALGGTSDNGDVCVQATNLETPSITAREGACVNVVGPAIGDIDNDGIPNGSDPDIDGDGIPNADDTTPNGGSDNGSDPGNDTGGNTGGTYTTGGAVPVGYTYNANFASCPANFAEALRTRFLADGSQTYFNASYLYSIGQRDESDAAWDEYYILDDAAWEAASVLSPFQQATLDNFDGYVSDVPGYDELEDIFWDTPNQADFNLMNEKMASAVPTFCGAVTAGTGTLKCHPETKTYIALSNAYYHNYMYENQRYSVDPTPANEAAWTASSAALQGNAQSYIDDRAKDDAYTAMIQAVGYDYEVTMAQNMRRAELNASLDTFQADTSRTNFDLWVNLEYPVNACR